MDCGFLFKAEHLPEFKYPNECPECGRTKVKPFLGDVREMDGYALGFPEIGKEYRFNVCGTLLPGTCIGVDPRDEYALMCHIDEVYGVWFCDIFEEE